jgi:hypothetical protein
MAKQLTSAQKSARIVTPTKTSGSSRGKATREATRMLSRKQSVNATKLTRAGTDQ